MNKKSYNLINQPHAKLKPEKKCFCNDFIGGVCHYCYNDAIRKGEELTQAFNSVDGTLSMANNRINKLEKENKALRENWQELLIFAKEHDAGKSLYVEASEFIDYMNKLEGN